MTDEPQTMQDAVVEAVTMLRALSLANAPKPEDAEVCVEVWLHVMADLNAEEVRLAVGAYIQAGEKWWPAPSEIRRLVPHLEAWKVDREKLKHGNPSRLLATLVGMLGGVASATRDEWALGIAYRRMLEAYEAMPLEQRQIDVDRAVRDAHPSPGVERNRVPMPFPEPVMAALRGVALPMLEVIEGGLKDG